MAVNHCAGRATDLIVRRQLGTAEWDLRGRLRGPAPGQVTGFGGPHALTINRDFAETLDRWARNLDHWLHHYGPVVGSRRIAWFGEVGSLACHRPTAAHNRGRGLDLCQVRFTDGDLVDMNASPVGSLHHQRLYLAVAANLRRYFGTVLTNHYNAAHRDHIHVDDLTAVAPIRTDKRTDASLVQSAAGLLGGEPLAVDGVWGTRTEAAYRRLLTAFALDCTDPKSSVLDAQRFLGYVVLTACADTDAGTYRSNVCEPCAGSVDGIERLGCDVNAMIAGI